jgi:hypothetical protein
VVLLAFGYAVVTIIARQKRRIFQGYYDNYWYVPLYDFCGDQLLAAYVCPARSTPASTAALS